MLKDYGSRDPTFLKFIAFIRTELLKLAHVDESTYTTALIQGSGTFAVESTIGTIIPRETDKKLLVLINGAYGNRMIRIADYYGIKTVSMAWKENEVVEPEKVRAFLKENQDVGFVSFIHHETTSGALNPVKDICTVIKEELPDA